MPAISTVSAIIGKRAFKGHKRLSHVELTLTLIFLFLYYTLT